MRVRIHGLKSAPEWNGVFAKVETNQNEQGRFKVRVETDGSVKVLKEKNLEIAEDQETPDSGK